MSAKPLDEKLFPLAKWDGTDFAEKGIAKQQLTDADFHFGINCEHCPANEFKFSGNVYKFGARQVDQQTRLGLILEDPLFNDFCESKKPASMRKASGQNNPNVQSVRDFWNERFKGKMPKEGRSGQDRDYNSAITGKVENNCGTNFNERFCKTALSWVAEKKQGRIHFHLDGMGDIAGIVHKLKEKNLYANAITSRELRYVYRNWSTLSKCTVLYNGYVEDGGKWYPMIVEPKWASSSA